ncbi:MAG: hypothetical protein V4772_19085 [Pseudomonadota bacterium]
MTTARKLTLNPINSQVFSVLTAEGEHVGNLKRIGGQWKFKAIGYEADGSVVPGGGPLTDRHNMTFSAADETLVNAGLGF